MRLFSCLPVLYQNINMCKSSLLSSCFGAMAPSNLNTAHRETPTSRVNINLIDRHSACIDPRPYPNGSGADSSNPTKRLRENIECGGSRWACWVSGERGSGAIWPQDWLQTTVSAVLSLSTSLCFSKYWHSERQQRHQWVDHSDTWLLLKGSVETYILVTGQLTLGCRWMKGKSLLCLQTRYGR